MVGEVEIYLNSHSQEFQFPKKDPKFRKIPFYEQKFVMCKVKRLLDKTPNLYWW